MFLPRRPVGSTSDLTVLALLAGILLTVQLINDLLGYRLLFLGIWPREPWGLPGVLLAVFLHRSWFHLGVNLVALLALGFVLLRQRAQPASLSGSLALLTPALSMLVGAAVWLLGSLGADQPYGVHVGASGLAFGYLGFALTQRSRRFAVAGTLGVLALLWLEGMALDRWEGISWESHFAGLGFGLALGGAERLYRSGRPSAFFRRVLAWLEQGKSTWR